MNTDETHHTLMGDGRYLALINQGEHVAAAARAHEIINPPLTLPPRTPREQRKLGLGLQPDDNMDETAGIVTIRCKRCVVQLSLDEWQQIRRRNKYEARAAAVHQVLYNHPAPAGSRPAMRVVATDAAIAAAKH